MFKICLCWNTHKNLRRNKRGIWRPNSLQVDTKMLNLSLKLLRNPIIKTLIIIMISELIIRKAHHRRYWGTISKRRSDLPVVIKPTSLCKNSKSNSIPHWQINYKKSPLSIILLLSYPHREGKLRSKQWCNSRFLLLRWILSKNLLSSITKKVQSEISKRCGNSWQPAAFLRWMNW